MAIRFLDGKTKQMTNELYWANRCGGFASADFRFKHDARASARTGISTTARFRRFHAPV